MTLRPDPTPRRSGAGRVYAADRDASFEFHVLDLLVDRHRASDVPVRPELARLAALPGVRTLCVYGTEENDSPCREVADAPTLRKVERAGAHHLDGDFPALGRLALDELARAGAASSPP